MQSPTGHRTANRRRTGSWTKLSKPGGSSGSTKKHDRLNNPARPGGKHSSGQLAQAKRPDQLTNDALPRLRATSTRPALISVSTLSEPGSGSSVAALDCIDRRHSRTTVLCGSDDADQFCRCF